MKPVRRAVLVAHPHKEHGAVRDGVAALLAARGIACAELTVPVGAHEAAARVAPPAADLVITLGGDGTLLYAARLFHGSAAPVLAVNLGTFGFLTTVAADEAVEALAAVLDGAGEIEERSLVSVSVTRDGASIGEFVALNEAVVGRRELTRMLTLRVEVDGRYLCTYRADGLIVSTATGSTAYALSAHGPILMPGLPNLLVVPICPHTLASRPFLLAADDEVSITMGGHDVHPVLSLDMQTGLELRPGDRLAARRAPHPLRLVRSSKRDFFRVLRDKLGWQE